MEVEQGYLSPSLVIGSVGNLWMVRGFGNEVGEVDEKTDWSRCQ